MSKIGKQPVQFPSGISLDQTAESYTITGPKGKIVVPIVPFTKVTLTDGSAVVERTNDERQARANHGLLRSLLQNAVVGVSEGFSKTLKLVGTGYRVQAKGQAVSLAVGYSHTVDVAPRPGVSFVVQGNDTIVVSGVDKQQVGQAAAEIRIIRPPEPYKGKGIRYEDEVVRRKQGKTASA